MISLGERTACDIKPILPVAPLDRLVEIRRFDAVRGTDLLHLYVGLVRDALTDKKFSPLRGRRRNAPRAKRGRRASGGVTVTASSPHERSDMRDKSRTRMSLHSSAGYGDSALNLPLTKCV